MNYMFVFISLKYSLVVCAYTLMEMESSVKRMEVVQTLWDRLVNMEISVKKNGGRTDPL